MTLKGLSESNSNLHREIHVFFVKSYLISKDHFDDDEKWLIWKKLNKFTTLVNSILIIVTQ